MLLAIQCATFELLSGVIIAEPHTCAERLIYPGDPT
jgi:hypothetical protein